MATLQKIKSFEYRENGVVYTPTELADFVARKVVRLWSEDVLHKSSDKQAVLSDLKIIDPACGEGELLLASARALEKNLGNRFSVKTEDVLYGIDIDQQALLKNIENIFYLPVALKKPWNCTENLEAKTRILKLLLKKED